MKLCKDCKHLYYQVSETYAGAFGNGGLIERRQTPACMHEECRNVVSGRTDSCEQARQGACGQEGKFWEAK
jgi:hypothetical protein